jgi:hypothetical protein
MARDIKESFVFTDDITLRVVEEPGCESPEVWCGHCKISDNVSVKVPWEAVFLHFQDHDAVGHDVSTIEQELAFIAEEY